MSECGHLVCGIHGCHLEECLSWHAQLARHGGRISTEAPV